MSIIEWVLFYGFAVLSIVPVIKLDTVKTQNKYRYLWNLSVIVFTWSVFTGLRLVVKEPFFLYYTSLATYPIVFLIAFHIYRTFTAYTQKEMHPNAVWAARIVFIINVIITLTNPIHQWMVQITITPDLTINQFVNVSRGFFFWIHTAVSYLLIILSFMNLMTYLYKNRKKSMGVFPYQFVTISIIFGVAANLFHLFVYASRLDPTYLFVVIVNYGIYTIIYQRDFNINLITTSKQFMLEKMREMYIISNNEGEVLEVSMNLKEKFDIEIQENQTIDKLLKTLSKKAVLFTDIMSLEHEKFNHKMVYLDIHTEDFNIKRFKTKGILTLLYDQTEEMKLLHEIDFIRSHDIMTKLYNRNYFESCKFQLEKDYPQLGIILIDIDGLKQFNDFLGHHAGDKLVKRFGLVLQKMNQVHKDLLTIRFGGDEFLIIVKEADEEKLKSVVRFIRERTEHHNPIEQISFSYGLALRNNQYPTFKELLQFADKKLYQKKESHKRRKETLIKALETYVQSNK